MGGKTSTSTSTVQVPSDVLARYNSVNATAETAAATPFQSYSSDPNAFVAPLTATQQAGIQNTNTAAGQAQPYYNAATNVLGQAQSSTSPYFNSATDALFQGQNMGQTAYGQSYNALNSGLSNASALQSPAQGLAVQSTQAVNPTQIGAEQINQFMNPYIGDVLNSTSALLNQNNQQAQAGQLGNAISSGAFGGDRAGIAAANLNQQQNLANANIYSGILNQGYNTALGAAQQQQGVNLGAQQANRAALLSGSQQLGNLGQQAYAQGLGASQQLASDAQGLNAIDTGVASGLESLGQANYNVGANTANSLAGLGAGAQSAALQGANAQLTAGQQEQATQQAGQTALYNQFLQQQAYPFQTAQFLANVAEGTGSLSGSTTSTTQPTGLFGNLLSDRRAKEDIREMGKAKNGLKIYSFRYKGDPEKVTHIGFMADEVEKKHPEAVGLAGGLKTVDYERASRADGGGLVFDPNAGEYGLGASAMPGRGTYVPAPSQSAARHIMFQATPPNPKSQGLGQLASDYKSAKGLYNDGSQIWNDGKSLISGLGSASTPDVNSGLYSHGGLALKRDDGGPVDDPYQSDADLMKRQRGLMAGENAIEQAPNSSAESPVSGALSAQANAPKYTLGAAPSPKGNNNSNGLGDLAAIAGMTKDVLPYILALKAGGLVPREHHADGDIVGDDDNPHGDAPVDPVMTPQAMYDATQAPLHDRRPMPDSPARSPYGGLSPVASPSSDETIPVPPKRPAGLNPSVSPDDVRALPDLQMPDEPILWHGSNYGDQTYHYQPNGRMGPTMVADAPQAGLGAAAAPADRVMTGLDPNAVASGAPLNVRNNNPGNLIDGDFARSIPGYAGADKHGFAIFNTPEAGNAAAERNLIAYSRKGINTPAQIISRWSPPNAPGNSPEATGNYIKYVSSRLGVSPNTPLDMSDPNVRQATVSAIREFEGGLPPGASRTALGAAQGSPTTGGGQSASPGQGGLVPSLQSFFHGNPDGQTSPNGGMGERALMAVLSGLGAIGSYKGQSGLGALLQGLGAGAHGWMESGTQQADIAQTQAHTGLTNVEAGRGSVLPEYGYVLGPDGRLHVIDKSIGSTGVPLMGGVPTAATKPANGASPSPPSVATPKAPAAPAAPTPPAGPDLTGVGYDADSAAKAKNETLYGPQAMRDRDQSAAYQDSTRQASLHAQESAPYTRTLATTLAEAAQQRGVNTPGAGFTDRAGMINTLNTTARMFGAGENFFGDADKGKVLESKVNTLQGLMRSQGADQHSLGAFDALKGANATLDQPPEASAEIAARLMTDQMRAQDRQSHMEHWKADSPAATVLGAQEDFTAKNGPQKYDRETSQISNLILKQGKYFEALNSGNYPPAQIARSLKAHGLDPALARYFGRGQ